jgi:ribA/ribD-fused uncharacterized protein
MVCIQCHTPAPNFTATTEGLQLRFCSHKCCRAYWEEYGQFGRSAVALQQGPRICRYPGCTKPCFREGAKVHDYCGRTHAQQHGAMMSGKGSGKGGGGWNLKQSTGGYGRQGSPKLGSGSSSWFNQSGPIKFYNRGEPYYEFTNFYEAIVNIDGEDWLTTEHYFQAQKFVGTPLVGTIRMMSRPREAFDKSRDPRYSPWRRSDWEDIKEDVMYKALQAKFHQHKGLGQQLRDTGDRELIKHSPYDSYWGDGGNGTGKNRLGVLLMRLRDDMKPKIAVSAPSPPSPIHANRQYSPQDSVHRDSVRHDSGTTSTSKTSSSPSSSPTVACKQKQDDDGPTGQPPSRPRANSSNDQSNTPAPQPVNPSLSSDAQNSGTSTSNVGTHQQIHATTTTHAVSPAHPAASSVSQYTQPQDHHPSSTATSLHSNDLSLTGSAPQKSTQYPDQSIGLAQGTPTHAVTQGGSQPQGATIHTLHGSVQCTPLQPVQCAGAVAQASSQLHVQPHNFQLVGADQRMGLPQQMSAISSTGSALQESTQQSGNLMGNYGLTPTARSPLPGFAQSMRPSYAGAVVGVSQPQGTATCSRSSLPALIPSQPALYTSAVVLHVGVSQSQGTASYTLVPPGSAQRIPSQLPALNSQSNACPSVGNPPTEPQNDPVPMEH